MRTDDNGFHLRGTPSDGAYVVSNVFRHSSLFASVDPFGQFHIGALEQNETGLRTEDDRVNMNLSPSYGSCDFDGDGVNDRFWATGETWWFSSGGNMPWTYLNTSKLMLSDMVLRDFDGDGRCDILANGALYSGGSMISY